MPKGAGILKAFYVSPELADIIGKNVASRPECIKGLWAYIKRYNLQDADNKQYIIPDARMAKVFGYDRMRGFSMSKFIGQFLSEIPEEEEVEVLAASPGAPAYPTEPEPIMILGD